MSKRERSYRVLKENATRFVIGLFIYAFVILLYVWQPAVLQQVDRDVYDIFLRDNGGGEPSPTPALIDLDEESLEEFGQWPWPRHLVGKLVAILAESGAAAIGLDIILAEPDNSSVINLQKSFKKHFDITIPLDGIPESLHDNDRILASIIAQTPTVVGVYTRFGGEPEPFPENLPYPEGIVDLQRPGQLPPRQFLMQAMGATLPLPELRAVAPMGSLNVAPDPDGIIRSVPLIAQVDGRTFISLSLRSLMVGLGVNTLQLVSSKDGLKGLALSKDRIIPVDRDGRFRVAFRGPRGYYPTFSAADILNKKIPPEEIQGRVLIVGTSAPGLLDIRATPFDSIYPGAEVHTTVIDAILSERYIQEPPWSQGAQFMGMTVVGILGTLVFAIAPAIIYLPILISLLGTSFWGSWRIFQEGLYLSPQYVMILVSALALSLLAVRFWQEARQKRTLRNAFSRYIAPDMVARIVERGEAVLAGEERIVTLMFTDIRGFTTMSEGLTPDQVVGALNRYFTPMTAIIRGSHGTVDKFIGDAIMAFWNAPLDVHQHELHAVKSAMQMQVALSELNVELQKDIGISLRMGAGVHTGKVYVGNMGSAELLDYTCIGDTVNLTSRLEGLCPVYGVGVVTSLETAKLCQAFANMDEESVGDSADKKERSPILQEVPFFLPLDSIRVKGKTEPVEICTPIYEQERMARQGEIEYFLSARRSYIEGNFASALKDFTALLAEFPDAILYQLYKERSQELHANPPELWEGVWTFTKK